MVYKLLFIHKICTRKYFILKMWNQCCVMLFTFLIYGKEGKYKSNIYLMFKMTKVLNKNELIWHMCEVKA